MVNPRTNERDAMMIACKDDIEIKFFTADDLTSLREFYALQYRVFVAEQGWDLLLGADVANLQPSDADRESIFALAIHKHAGVVGCARGMVGLKSSSPQYDLFEKHLRLGCLTSRSHVVGVLSGLAVVSSFRDIRGIGSMLVEGISIQMQDAGCEVVMAATGVQEAACLFMKSDFYVIDAPYRNQGPTRHLMNFARVLQTAPDKTSDQKAVLWREQARQFFLQSELRIERKSCLSVRDLVLNYLVPVDDLSIPVGAVSGLRPFR